MSTCYFIKWLVPLIMWWAIITSIILLRKNVAILLNQRWLKKARNLIQQDNESYKYTNRMRTAIMMLSVSVWVAVTSLVMALPSQHMIQTRSQKLCGAQLAQALSIVCGGFYYFPQKRPDSDFFKNELTTVPWWRMMKDLQTLSDGEYLDSKMAMSMFRKRDSLARQTRGVSDECCTKSCSINELMSYCGSSGKK